MVPTITQLSSALRSEVSHVATREFLPWASQKCVNAVLLPSINFTVRTCAKHDCHPPHDLQQTGKYMCHELYLPGVFSHTGQSWSLNKSVFPYLTQKADASIYIYLSCTQVRPPSDHSVYGRHHPGSEKSSNYFYLMQNVTILFIRSCIHQHFGLLLVPHHSMHRW